MNGAPSGGVNYDDSNICGIDTIRNNNSNK